MVFCFTELFSKTLCFLCWSGVCHEGPRIHCGISAGNSLQRNCRCSRADGGIPFATPILDRKGNIFGTASQGNGGLFSNCSSFCGTVYELSPPGAGASSWTETTLYSFVGVNGLVFDGAYPVGSLLLGRHGTLYGTTMQGGDFGGDGAVFEVAP